VVSFDATILFQLFNFLFLLFVLNQVFFKPILKIQQERQAFLDQTQSAAQAKHTELKTLRTDYNQKLDAARQQAYDQVSTEVEQANKARETRLAEIQADAEARFEAARTQIAAQETELRQALEKEIQPLASLIFSQLLQSQSSQKQEVKS